MRCLSCFFTLIVFLTASLSAQAGIYTFSDAQGVVHFTNKPSDPRYAKMTRVGFLAESIRYNPAEQRINVTRYLPLVEKAAREHQVDRALLSAVITVESGFDPNAVSSKGAVGLMQLMPATARRYGITNLYDPAQNIQGGAKYLRYLMRKFNNDLSLTLAAYNAGEETVQRYGNRLPPYQETRLYVPKVMDAYRQYQRIKN